MFEHAEMGNNTRKSAYNPSSLLKHILSKFSSFNLPYFFTFFPSCRPAEPRFPIHIGISGYVAATGQVSKRNLDNLFFDKNNQKSTFGIPKYVAI